MPSTGGERRLRTAPRRLAVDLQRDLALGGANQHGDAIVAWQRRIDDYDSTVEVARRPAGGPFAPAVELSEPPAPSALHPWGQNLTPSTAIDQAGRAVVVWERAGTITTVTLEPGGAPGPRQVISQAFVSNGQPRVAVDPAGNATAFWIDGADHLGVATRPAGEGFGAPVSVGAPGTWPARYDMAVGGNGDAAVVWTPGGDMNVALRQGMGPWTATRLRTPDDHLDTAIGHVAMNARGDALVAWAEQDGSGNGWVRASYRRAGGAFGPVETVAKVFYTATFEATVAVDSHGNGLVAWLGRSLDPYYDAVQTARPRSASGTWGAFETLSAMEPAYEAPRLAFDAGDVAYAAWRRYDTPETYDARALAAVRPAGSTQWTMSWLSQPTGNVWPPVLVAGAPGRALVAYPRGSTELFHLEVAESGASAAAASGSRAPAAAACPAASRSRAAAKAAGRALLARALVALRRGGSRALLGRGVAVRLPSCRSKVEVALYLGPARRVPARLVARWSGAGRGQVAHLGAHGRSARRLVRRTAGHRARVVLRSTVEGLARRRVVVLRFPKT